MTFDCQEELRHRITLDIDHYQGALPERFAIAWHAYLAGLLEWGILDISAYDELVALLPAVEDDPVAVILLGRE